MAITRAAVVYFILLFGFNQQFIAQKLKFKNYTTSEGLLSDEVYNLHQDKNGYIWLFTNYGVSKYNGKEFKQVLTNLPINESFIYCVYENSTGKKWVANSNAKIYEIRNDSAFQLKGTEIVSEILRKSVSEIKQIHVDDSLNVYTITKHHSYKFINKKNIYYGVCLSVGNHDSISHRVYNHGAFSYLIYNYNENDTVAYGGLDAFRTMFFDRNDSFYMKLECNPSGTRKIKWYNDSQIYFDSYNKIGRIKNKKKLPPVPLKSIVLNFNKDKNNHLWIGCYNGGLYELNEKDSIINHYFDNTTINDILVDSQNGLWVSSSGKGVFYCNNRNDYYFNSESEFGKPISWIKNIENELFIANSIGDIFKIKNSTITNFRKNNKLGEVLDFIKVKNKYILSHINDNEYSWFYPIHKTKNGLIPLAIKMLVFNKDTLAFLTRKNLTLIINGLIKGSYNINNKASTCFLKDGNVFIGTEDGLYVLENKTISQPYYLSETKSVKIKSIYGDSFKNLWISTIGAGVYKLDYKNRLHQYSVLNGLPGNIINNIDFNDSSVFLSTNIGLFYAKTINNSLDSLDWKKLYSGLVNNAIFFENKIYLATQKGLVILENRKLTNSDKIYFNTKIIKINEKEIPIQKIQDLTYNENNLEFVFDIISFKSEKYNLKYILTGSTNDSGVVETDAILLKKLTPGKYNLLVYPLVEGGEKLKLEFTFHIEPAFWQTRTFFIVLSLVLMVLLILTIWLLFKYFKRKDKKKAKAERLILEYKLIALKAQINPHFMSNCLSAIQNLLISNKLVEATDYLAKFGRLVRHILNFSTRSLVTLAEELEIAALNIALEQLRFENKFNYDLKIDPSIEPKNIFVPALVLNPIIENAIWHGLLPLKNKRSAKLLIKISCNSEVLFLTILDNGVGRIGNNFNFGNIHESKGIKLTEQRLNNINYMYGENFSTIVYTDLYDELNERAGTKVVISIPKTLKPFNNE